MKTNNVCLYLILLVFFSCTEKKKQAEGDSFSTGKSEIWVEDAFKPIIEEQLAVFSASNPQATLKANYGDENSIVNDLLKSGGRTVIISRELSKKEIAVLKGKNFTPEINRIAIDAVALISNKYDMDSIITIADLKKMLTGEKTDKNVVFDNPNSGTLRFLKSFSKAPLDAKNLYALKSNSAVIEYISSHSNAIGVIGFNWLNDTTGKIGQQLKRLRLMGVQDTSGKTYFKPSQTTLALKQYPLRTGIYIINASGRKGLGAGFANFLVGERGQRILLKSELLPEQIPSREINIRN